VSGFLVREVRWALRDRVEGADDLEGFGVAGRPGVVSECPGYRSQSLRPNGLIERRPIRSGGGKSLLTGLAPRQRCRSADAVPKAGQTNANDHLDGS
jgi:hypothetical protein